MYYLRTGDINNSREINNLQQHNDVADMFMNMIYAHTLKVDEIIEAIYQSDTFDTKVYNRICYLLTLGDLLPPEDFIDFYLAVSHYFCLQVNVLASDNRSDKRVPSPYLAIKTAQAFNWDYSEYIKSEETLADNLQKETMVVSLRFSYLLNEITIQIPVTEVKKGFIRKKSVGYMLDTSLSSYGIMNIGNNKDNYKVPKSYILSLMDDRIVSDEKFIFEDKLSFASAIDRFNSASIMLDVLYINGFFGVGTYTNDSGEEVYVDADDGLLYVTSRELPTYDEYEDDVGSPVKWEQVREHLYRALTSNHKLYVSYRYGNKIVLMTN